MSKSVIEKQPIEGWLILLAIVVWLSAFGSVIGCIAFIILGKAPLRLVLAIITLVLSAISLVLFHMKKRAFVSMFLTLQYVLVIANGLFLVKDIVNHIGAGRIITMFGPTDVEIILIIGYLIRSKRVKYTFVG